jgi:hypothetical protein
MTSQRLETVPITRDSKYEPTHRSVAANRGQATTRSSAAELLTKTLLRACVNQMLAFLARY